MSANEIHSPRAFHVCVFGVKVYGGLSMEAKHGSLLDGFACADRRCVSRPGGIPSGSRGTLQGLGTMAAKIAAPTTRNRFHRTLAPWRRSAARHHGRERTAAAAGACRNSRCQSGGTRRTLWREWQPHEHRAGTPALGHHAKKKSLICAEQQDPKVQKQRKAWQRKIKDIEPARFKFLDQTNAKTTFSRIFARAPRGQRVREYVPDGRWKSLTLMGTLGYWGDMTALTYEGGTDVMAMVTFLEEILAPKLDREHIVVLDRLSSHMNPQVTQIVRATGAALWHLPPYSHDFNPIEPGWGHQKQYVRKHAPRTSADLVRVARRARHRITPRHCRSWFAHSGYSVQHK